MDSMPDDLRKATNAFIDEYSKHDARTRILLLTSLIGAEITTKDPAVYEILASFVIANLMDILERENSIKLDAVKEVEDVIRRIRLIKKQR